MSYGIDFGGYKIGFKVLTTGNVYDVDEVERSEEDGQVVFRATKLSYGAGTGNVPAFFEARFEEQPNGLSWNARAEHAEPIKGIKVFIETFPLGTIIRPPGVRMDLDEGPGRCFVYPSGSHPLRDRGGETGIIPRTGGLPGMAAQFVLIEGPEETICIRGGEHPPRIKRFWFYRQGDRLEVNLYSEENACDRGNQYTAPTWTIEHVPSWENAVDGYVEWMEEAFALVPFEEREDVPDWLRKTCLVTILHGVSSDGKMCHNFAQMEDRLHQLAAVFPPENTLVKLLGHEGRVDYHLPDNLPGEELGGHEGFASFMETAHKLGFRVLLHMNIWGMAFDHPRFPEMRQHQIRDISGWPSQWGVDYDKDEAQEATFAYISPDVAAFRKMQVDGIGLLIDRYKPDAFHMDQSAFPINDLGHNHWRGVGLLFEDLGRAFPNVLFSGEGASEWIAGMYPLSSGQSAMGRGSDANVEMFKRIIGKYMRCYAHSASIPPEPWRGVWTFDEFERWWTEERFRRTEDAYARSGAIPTLVLTDKRISLDGELARLVLDRAQRWLGKL